MKRISFIFLVVLSACTVMQAAKMSSVESVTLSEHELNVFVGATVRLQATVVPSDLEGSSLTWSTDNWNIAVDNDGLVSAFREGVAHITAATTDGSKSDTCTVRATYRHQGQCGEYLYWTLDKNYRLSIWADKIEGYKFDADASHSMDMFDYSPAEPAPWYQWRDSITEIYLYNVEHIGDYAFMGCTNVYYVMIYEGAKFGDYVFWGCTNLTTLEQRDTVASQVTANSLKISNTKEIDLIVVDENSDLSKFKNHPIWGASNRLVMSASGAWGETRWRISQSDSLRSLKLQIDYNYMLDPAPSEVSIPDIDTTNVSARAPWHDLRGRVEDLMIGDRVVYLGRNAFSSLTGLETVQFFQSTMTLNSMHFDAFAHTITPWKFAFGDPDGGPLIPPQIIGMEKEPTNYAVKTMLYVPDQFASDVDTAKSIDLYRTAPYWQSFNRITDRTVAVDNVTSNSASLQWFPVEKAVLYRLWISRKDCAECDTTIEIPALDGQGLVDWGRITIPSYLAPRRMPQGDDGHGGMTLVIKIQTGSGTSANCEISLNASGLQAETDYAYRREVEYSSGYTSPAMTKVGEFHTPAMSPDVPTFVPEQKVRIESVRGVYDMLGRRVADDAKGLPTGLFLIDNGTTRTKVLVRP